MSTLIQATVNGVAYSHLVEPRLLLVHYLRDVLRLTGTHVGCDTSSCGACTIHLNGKATKSCTMLAVQASGAKVVTIEGLAKGDKLHPVQQAWIEHDVAQCGYCQPGQIIAAAALLQAKKKPTDAEIDSAMSGHICRCGTYPKIREAIKSLAGGGK